MITVIKDIATGVAACIAAGVALSGLSTWKRQIKGQAEYELARRILKNIYKIRDTTTRLSHTLHLVLFDADDFSDEERVKIYCELFSFYLDESEFKALSDLWSEMETDFQEAEVVFGHPVKIEFISMEDHFSRLIDTGILLSSCAKQDPATTRLLNTQINNCLREDSKYFRDKNLDERFYGIVDSAVEASGLRRHLGQSDKEKSLRSRFSKKKTPGHVFPAPSHESILRARPKRARK